VNTARRLLSYVFYITACFYFLMPFRTPVPGLSTVTVFKGVGLLLALSVLGGMADARYRRMYLQLAARFWPAPVLAAWVLATGFVRMGTVFLEVKMLAGFAVGVVVMFALALELSEPVVRRRAAILVLVAGFLSAAAGLLEPGLTPWADGFWRLFRPNVEIFDPVQGRAAGLAALHWQGYGSMRVSGLFSDPNHLGNFLVAWFPILAFVLLSARRVPAWGWVGALAGSLVATMALSATMTRSAIVACGGGAAVFAGVLTLKAIMARDLSRRSWIAVAAGAVLGTAVIALAGGGASRVAYGGALFLVAAAAVWIPGRTRAHHTRRAALVVSGLGLVVLIAMPVTARLQPSSGSYRLAGQPVVQMVSWRGDLWRCAGRAIRANPLTGRGYVAFYGDIIREFKGFYPGVSGPHNLYLTAWVTGGLVALGLLLHFLVMVIARAWHLLHRAGKDGDGRGLGTAMLWYWCSYLLLGLVGQDPFPVDEALIFGAWGALAIAPLGVRKKP